MNKKRLLFPFLILLAFSAFAQMPNLDGKTVGIYFSGKQFSFGDGDYMRMSQFLQVGDDRSWGENIKAEFLVRLGERLRLEMQIKTGADSVFFINSDMERGAAFLEVYRPDHNTLDMQSPLFRDTDIILVMTELAFSDRYIKSMVIRSNRMIPSRTRVHKARLAMSWFAVGKQASLFQTTTCYDEKLKKKIDPTMDIYHDDSPMGSFLSQLFSHWLIQSQEGLASDCK